MSRVSLLLLLAGCLPATQTVVTLDVESVAELEESSSLQVRIVSDDGLRDFTKELDPRDHWPIQIPISPLGGDANRRFTFSATLQTMEGRVVEVGAALGFAEKDRFDVALRFEAICLETSCLEGFTCIGGECVSSFTEAGQCGIGSERGCDPANDCGCPENYECLEFSEGTTCRPASCSGSTECADGDVCSFSLRRCVPSSVSSCEAPTRLGPREPGETCTTELGCQAGYACVGSFVSDGESGFAYSSTGSRCARACNPCETSQTCTAPDGCVALPEGGGFCSRGGLALLGETCGSGRACAGGLTCRNDTCRTACRAEFEGSPGNACARESMLCSSGEACVGAHGADRGYCARGLPARFEGGICTAAASCGCPLSCQNVSGTEYKVCAAPQGLSCGRCPGPDCRCPGPDCPCPDNLECRTSHGDILCADPDLGACAGCPDGPECPCSAEQRCVDLGGVNTCVVAAACRECPGGSCPCDDGQRCISTVGGAACVADGTLGTFDPCEANQECASGDCANGACSP